MSVLTIEFRQMFLLINRTNGATVLIPSQGHTAKLTGSIFTDVITLSQAGVVVRREKADLADKPTLRPGAKFLPYLDYVFHTPVAPLPEAKTTEIPESLNARVNLAGGFLTELPASNEKYADVMWDFLKPDGKSMLRQQLTDRLLFTLPMDEGVGYQLIVKMGGAEQTWDIPSTGANFVLLNDDTGTLKTIGAAGAPTQLKEYAILYNLTTASDFTTLYPFPTADINSVGGGQAPVCGGGQGDGDDDPPPGGRPGR